MNAETVMRRYNARSADIISYTVSFVPPLNSVLFLKIWEKRVKIWGKEPIRITQAVCIHLDSDIAA